MTKWNEDKDTIIVFTQVKWPHDYKQLLTSSRYHLDSVTTEMNNRMMELKRDATINGEYQYEIHFVHTGESLHHYTAENKFRGINFRDIGIKALRQEFDDNRPFWNKAYELVSETQPTVGNGKIIHPCQNQETYWPDLFKDCKGILEFNRRHEKLIKGLEEDNGMEIKTYDAPHRWGDGGEMFTLCMYRLSEQNKRFAVLDYQKSPDDNGHDGEGWRYK